jgi:hypothetical protein
MLVQIRPKHPSSIEAPYPFFTNSGARSMPVNGSRKVRRPGLDRYEGESENAVHALHGHPSFSIADK